VGGGDPALSHHRIAQGLPGLLFPTQRRLALVGDADRRDLRGRNSRRHRRFGGPMPLTPPDLFGIMLDMTRLGIELRQFPLGEATRLLPQADLRGFRPWAFSSVRNSTCRQLICCLRRT
jgi:hypothetical protein